MNKCVVCGYISWPNSIACNDCVNKYYRRHADVYYIVESEIGRIDTKNHDEFVSRLTEILQSMILSECV